MGPRRRERPHQLRRPGRRVRDASASSTASRSRRSTPNLTAGVDLTRARRLRENVGHRLHGRHRRAARSTSTRDAAARLLARTEPGRPRRTPTSSGRGSNGLDITRPAARHVDHRLRRRHVRATRRRCTRRRSSTSREHVKPVRDGVRRAPYASAGGSTSEPRPEMRARARAASTGTSRRRDVRSTGSSSGCDAATLCRPRSSSSSPATTTTPSASSTRASTSCGRARTGTQLREVESGFRYTPTTCFETFPFPRPTDEQREAIAAAARAPRPSSATAGSTRPASTPPSSRSAPSPTSTTQRPTWLANAHADLDAAVLAAYGWPPDLADEDLLARLLALNLERAVSFVSAAGKYRLYIDEVGNHDLNVADRDPSDLARYLSLTGVIVDSSTFGRPSVPRWRG